jgi:ParB/RepB/Spo0J family partition protein
MAREKMKVDIGRFFRHDEQAHDIDFLMKVADEETVEYATERGLPMLNLPLTAIAPDPQQLRRLPHPHQLLSMEAEGDQAAATLLTGLRELGQSMQEQGQLQPAIVYPYNNPDDPTITHRMLHGQRRWSAAILMELPTLWVVEIQTPSNIQRILRQFDENERREGLSDMERAWALKSLKESLEEETGADIAWNTIEEYMQISEPRRKDLLRLLRFSEQGQEIILRYNWSEWTLRPLHKVIQSNQIDQETALELLQKLALFEEVNATIVANLVESTLQNMAQPQETPAEEPPAVEIEEVVMKKGKQTARSMYRIRRNIDEFRTDILSAMEDDQVRDTLRKEAEELRVSVEALLQELSA